MAYRVRVTDYKPTTLNPKDVMSVAEAAKALGMTMPGVIRAIERGALTEVIDDQASYHNRRLLLRAEVERLLRKKSPERDSPPASEVAMENPTADPQVSAAPFQTNDPTYLIDRESKKEGLRNRLGEANFEAFEKALRELSDSQTQGLPISNWRLKSRSNLAIASFLLPDQTESFWLKTLNRIICALQFNFINLFSFPWSEPVKRAHMNGIRARIEHE